MPQTENIVKFLQINYSDRRLAELLAHAQDAKLGYYSCCCFVGIVNAPHALVPAVTDAEYPALFGTRDDNHVNEARECPFAYAAENEFFHLGTDDAERRAAIIPLILAEQDRRDQIRATSTASILDRKEESVLA